MTSRIELTLPLPLDHNPKEYHRVVDADGVVTTSPALVHQFAGDTECILRLPQCLLCCAKAIAEEEAKSVATTKEKA